MKLPARPELGQKAQILLGILLGFLLLLFFSAEPPLIFGGGIFECKTECVPDPTGFFTVCSCQTINRCEGGQHPAVCPESSDLPEDCIGCTGKVCVYEGEFACISPCDCEPHRELQDCGPNARCVVGFCDPVGSVIGKCEPIVSTCAEVGGVCCQTACDSGGPLEGSCITGVCCAQGCTAEDGDGEPSEACPGGCCPTPIGCIPTDLDTFAGWMLERAIYLGVLVAILLIIISGYGIVSSTGDPERLAEAKSRLTAAVAGLLFLLFSVIILRIIACNILGGDAKEFFCP